MKQENNLPYTVLDEDGRIIKTEESTKRSMRKAVWISALVLAALGALALFFPIAVGTGFAFLITAGVFLYGLSQGITYFRSPRENRSGWALANGSLLVIVSGVALSGALMSQLGILRMISILSFAAGFLAASIGVSQIAAGITNKTGRGWALLGGGLNLLVSFFMCVNPVVSWFALTTVWGAYLIADAITLLLAERWAQTGSRT